MNALAMAAPSLQPATGDPASAVPGKPRGGKRDSDLPNAAGRILVVDDEEDIRDALELAFLHEGFEVTTADCGATALREARQGQFDLAITDLRMPGMSGVDTITALRRIDPAMVVIVASGYATDETAADCIQRGAADYIRKPFDLEALMELVRRVLSERSA